MTGRGASPASTPPKDDKEEGALAAIGAAVSAPVLGADEEGPVGPR